MSSTRSVRQHKKILFIGGSGRSGSTLLEEVLNQVEGMFGVGELNFIWSKGYRTNQRCTCGEYFRDCSFWSELDEQVFEGLDDSEVEQVLSLQQDLNKRLNIPLRLFNCDVLNTYKSKAEELRTYYRRILEGIFELSGCEVLIDSSKSPLQALFLSEIEGYDFHLVHLVRDSRAVANSWQRKKRRWEVDWKEEYMPQFSLTKSATNWNYKNGIFHLLQDRFPSYIRLRYEDFVNSPKKVLQRIISQVGESGRRLNFIEGSKVRLTEKNYHSISGNPSRFRSDDITLQMDDEWKTNFDSIQTGYVTLLTSPLLKIFGYPSCEGIF
jgi:hypothetical protein